MYIHTYHCSLFLTVPDSPQNVQISLHQDVHVYNITWDPVDAPSVFYRVSHNINSLSMHVCACVYV